MVQSALQHRDLLLEPPSLGLFVADEADERSVVIDGKASEAGMGALVY